MGEERKRIEGQCLCGAVSVRARPERAGVEACHCTMCRKWGGSALLSVQCGSDVDIEGDPVRYRSSDWAERGFCGRCGSSLFYHFIPAGVYAFTAGLFPDDALDPLAEEIFIDEKPAYYSFDANCEKLTGAEVIAKAKAEGYEFPED